MRGIFYPFSSVSIDLSNYYTKEEIDEKFNNLKSPKPSIEISSDVNENDSLIGNFSIPENCDIKITAEKGTIKILSDTTFKYIAPSVSEEVIEDTIKAYSIAIGKLASDLVIKKINIHNIPLISDDVLSNSDFASNEENSLNIEY